VLFEENGVAGQCYNCNCKLKGNTTLYRFFMLERYGEEETKRIEMNIYKVMKYTKTDLIEIRAKYKRMYKELMESKI